MKNLYKTSLLIIVFFFFLPYCTQAAWEAPVGNPVSNNDVYPFIYNDEGDENGVYIFDTPFGIGNDFTVDNSLFVVDTSNNRVGINTNNPISTLDVNGLLRIAPLSSSNFPTCTNELEGSLLFNLTQDRLNICVNEAWRRIGYDGDLDGYLDSVDCDDTDPSTNVEICGDTISNDCDSLVNEGCTCTVNDWNSPVCSGMDNCTQPQIAYGTKKTSCVGNDNQPSTTCACICRSDFWVEPTCPYCGPNQIIYADLKDGYDCDDVNNTRLSINCPYAGCPSTSVSYSCGTGFLNNEYLKVYKTTKTYSCINGYCVASINKSYLKTCPSLGGIGGCKNGSCTNCYAVCGPCSTSVPEDWCTRTERVCNWTALGMTCGGCEVDCTPGCSSSPYICEALCWGSWMVIDGWGTCVNPSILNPF